MHAVIRVDAIKDHVCMYSGSVYVLTPLEYAGVGIYVCVS